MTFGLVSTGLAIVILVTGYLVSRGAYARPGWSIAGMSHDGSAMFPVVDLSMFALVVGTVLKFAVSGTPQWAQIANHLFG